MRALLFQFFFVAFSFLVILLAFQKRKRGLLSPRAAAFWIIFWLVADVAALFPGLSTRVANRFGIGRGSDFVLYLSIAVMFFLLFRLHIKIEMIQRDITKVVRKDALDV